MQTNFNIRNILEDITATQGPYASQNLPENPKWTNFKSLAFFILKIIVLIPLGLFFACTYLSPLHATDILFADFVFDPMYASTQGWIAFAISVAIWTLILLLYYVITVKLFKQDINPDRFTVQTVIIYFVVYLASTSFVIYYIVKQQNTRDYLFLAFQLGALGGISRKK